MVFHSLGKTDIPLLLRQFAFLRSNHLYMLQFDERILVEESFFKLRNLG